MSALYELTSEFESLFDRFEEISDYDYSLEENPEEMRRQMQQAWFDTLEGMELEIREKAEAVAVYIKNITAEAKAFKAEEDKLTVRRKAKENSAAKLKQYLMDCMNAARLSKIDMPRAAVSIRNNAESVKLTDENGLIGWAELHDRDDLLRYRTPEINKTAVKAALRSGEDIPGAVLERTRSVMIR